MFGLEQAIDNIKFKIVQNYFTSTPSLDLQRNSSKGYFTSITSQDLID